MSLQLAPVPGVVIAGSGSALPLDLPGADASEHRLSNREVYQLLLGADYEAELARRRLSIDHVEQELGISERQWVRGRAPVAQARFDCGDLAVHAARVALEQAQVRAQDIDVLLLATSTPPRITSSLAHAVAARLDTRAACLDVRAGGAGGLHAWVSATSYLAQGARKALVIATETPSLYLADHDLGSALVFGDGAGALVLERNASAQSGLIGAWMGSSAPAGVAFTVPGRLPPTHAAIEAGEYQFQANDAQYKQLLNTVWSDVGRELATHAVKANVDIDLFVPYAVSRARAELAAQTTGVPLERTFFDIANIGCVGSAGPLVALDRARRVGRLRADGCLATSAVAGGIAWASLLWRM